jgi:hypothetical protein
MCPCEGPDAATTTNRWDVRNGVFYQDGDAMKILALTKYQFVVQDISGRFDGTVFTFHRINRAQAEGQ